MKLIEFIREEFQYNEIASRYLWQFFQSDLVLNIYPPEGDELPETKIDFYNFELRGGTKIQFFGEVKFYGGAGSTTVDYSIPIKQLERDMSKIKGLGNKGINSFKDVFGHSFTVEEMEDNSEKLDGVGNMTLNNIVEFYQR